MNEEWRKLGPQVGDWVLPSPGSGAMVVQGVRRSGDVVEISFESGLRPRRFSPRGYLPLLQPLRLTEILEARGYRWNVGVKTVHTKADKYRAATFTDEEMTGYTIRTGESWSPTKAKIIWTGPDPATALLRALLEIFQEEE